MAQQIQKEPGPCRSNNGSTPEPNYNKHFPRSFTLNYGEALANLSDDKIMSSLRLELRVALAT